MKFKGKKISKKSITIGLGLFLIVTTAGFIIVPEVNNRKVKVEDVKIREYQVKKGDIVVGVNAGGAIALESKSHKFNGEVNIEEVFVKVGEEVKKGDKLAKISTKDIDEEISNLNAELKKAKLLLKKEKEVGEENKTTMEIAELEVNKINKDIEKLSKKKKNSIIVASTDGIILDVGYEPGIVSNSESKGITVGNLEEVSAVVTVEEGDITKLEKDQTVDLELTAYQDAKFKGKLYEINLKPNQEGGAPMYTVKIKLEETDKKLVEGMTLDARFIMKEFRDILVLSNKAINFKDGKQFVKIKNQEGQINEIEITTGFSDGKVSEIVSGVNEGDTVVVEG